MNNASIFDITRSPRVKAAALAILNAMSSRSGSGATISMQTGNGPVRKSLRQSVFTCDELMDAMEWIGRSGNLIDRLGLKPARSNCDDTGEVGARSRMVGRGPHGSRSVAFQGRMRHRREFPLAG